MKKQLLPFNFRWSMLTSLIYFLFLFYPSDIHAQDSMDANRLINGIPRTVNLSQAEDLVEEISNIADLIAIEYEKTPGKIYPPGADFWHGMATGTYLWSKGRLIYAESQLLEFINENRYPGLKSRLAQGIKADIQTTLLDTNYYQKEVSGSIGYRKADKQHDPWMPVLREGNDALDQQVWWSTNWRKLYLGGYSPWYGTGNEQSHWDSLLGLWAYAFYSGDWSLIRNNWQTIQTIRNNAIEYPVRDNRNFQGGMTTYNSWVAGIIAYARMEKEVAGSVSSTTLSAVNKAINARVNEGLLGNEYCSYEGSSSVYFLYGWHEMTFEVGRLLRSTNGSQFITTSDGHDNSGCIRFWREADMNHEHNGEGQTDLAWSSFPIYQGRIFARANINSDGSWSYNQTSRNELRLLLPQPVVSRAYPYHRSAFHLQNLVALTRVHGATQWNSEPLPTATQGTNTPTPTLPPTPGDANGDNKVDGIDYVIWLNNYNTQTSSGASKGDFNGDGRVDGIDYVIWLNNYGT